MARFTKTQRFILLAADKSPSGMVEFAAGDRAGTRIARRLEDGTPVIVAYGLPEGFLTSRGLLEPVGRPLHTYRLTPRGKAAIAGKTRHLEGA